MPGKIPHEIVADLNKYRWHQTDECNIYKEVNGEKVLQERPEGTVWFAWTGHSDAQQLAAALRDSPAKINAQVDFVGDVFGVSVPPSQLPALAENGVKFAREALTPGYKPSQRNQELG